jgi:hypothetical protein
MIKSPANQWQEAAGPFVLGPQKLLFAAPGNGLWYTENDGGSWEQVGPDGSSIMYRSPNGTMYMGTPGHGLAHSTDGHVWQYIDGWPSVNAIIGDGTTLFASYGYDKGGQPMYSAPENNPSKWTPMKTPTMISGGASFAYDSAHSILYSANWEAGLWRYATK